MNIKHKEHLHFIGIGGIGMSALARIALERGYSVSGSTLSGEASLLTCLQDMGAVIYSQHDAAQVHACVDKVIISSSIKENNAELKEARTRNIPILHRSQLLDALLEGYQVIAVSGTHGKTTTTALIGHMLTVAGYNPLIITGGIMPLYQSNIRYGTGAWAVVEADESDGTLLNLSRVDIAIVTNVESEHMEFYHTEDNLFSFFTQFLLKAKHSRILGGTGTFYQTFIEQHPSSSNLVYGHDAGDLQCHHVEPFAAGTQFDVIDVRHHQCWSKMYIALRGEHNVYNSLAAIAVAQKLNLESTLVRQAFSSFETVRRRLTLTGCFQGIQIVDDYAHHPTEIKAALKALRSHHAKEKIFVIFQPHRYTRLHALMSDFAESFGDADAVLLLPVYSAGEAPLLEADSNILHRKIQYHHQHVSVFLEWRESLTAISTYLLEHASPGDIVICCGAGDVTHLAYSLPSSLEVCASVYTCVEGDRAAVGFG
jgi:UDP-N-acetylmuramate--alanine ligase